MEGFDNSGISNSNISTLSSSVVPVGIASGSGDHPSNFSYQTSHINQIGSSTYTDLSTSCQPQGSVSSQSQNHLVTQGTSSPSTLSNIPSVGSTAAISGSSPPATIKKEVIDPIQSEANRISQNFASSCSGLPDEGNVQAAADSNSPKQTFVPCKVCGDRASGYHYGVTSCEGCKPVDLRVKHYGVTSYEGCKGFFRRSIQKQIEYRCLRDGKCMVIRLNRNRCQYCRFKKCLAVGMSRDSVRYGRVPKRAKVQEEQMRLSSSSEISVDQADLESKHLAIYDVILSVSQAHHAHCAVTEDKLKLLQRKPSTLITDLKLAAEGSLQFSSTELETQRLLMWQNMAVLITPSIQSVVEFSKRVPGFADLSQDDQLVLIKTGFFEIWVTRMCRMFNRVDNIITFEDGNVISKDEISVVFAPDFVQGMFEFAHSFCMLNLNDTEVGLFAGVVLATVDRPGLIDSNSVEKIQDKLIEALKLQITRNHSTEENLFTAVVMKLPELRTLSTQHNELITWYRTQWQRINLPPLYSEIYDVPKHDDTQG